MGSPLKLYLLARVELQMQSLNASGAIGNYTKLQEGHVIIDGEPVPVPVITGNALKNWHARAFAWHYKELGGGKIHVSHFETMYRLSRRALTDEELKKVRDAVNKKLEELKQRDQELRRWLLMNELEKQIVSSCAVCDVHGFLLAETARTEGEELPPTKRESLVKFSFAVPTEDFVRKNLKFVVTHNRVSLRAEEMMIFKREYASAVYAWLSTMEIASVGRSQYVKDESETSLWLGKKIVDDNDELRRRVKAAILAYEAPLTGSLGAATSRALAIARPLEVVAVVTRKVMPVPLHSFYNDYREDLGKLIERYRDAVSAVYLYNVELSVRDVEVKPCKDWRELLQNLAEDVARAL